jgi:hypothetical protein
MKTTDDARMGTLWLEFSSSEVRELISGLGWMSNEGADTPLSRRLQKFLVRSHCNNFGHGWKVNKGLTHPSHPNGGGKPFKYRMCNVCHKCEDLKP